MEDWSKKAEWINARTEALLGHVDDPALATLVPDGREAGLIMDQLRPVKMLREHVERLRGAALWTDEARHAFASSLRATLELALMEQFHGWTLPVVELARRCAQVAIAVAEDKSSLETCTLAAQMCAGVSGEVLRWVCPCGGGGVLARRSAEVRGMPCLLCGKPIKVVRED